LLAGAPATPGQHLMQASLVASAPPAGGFVIFTLKFMGFGRDRQKTLDHLNEAFAGCLQPGLLLWLMANSECERTFVARKLPDNALCA